MLCTIQNSIACRSLWTFSNSTYSTTYSYFYSGGGSGFDFDNLMFKSIDGVPMIRHLLKSLSAFKNKSFTASVERPAAYFRYVVDKFVVFDLWLSWLQENVLCLRSLVCTLSDAVVLQLSISLVMAITHMLLN